MNTRIRPATYADLSAIIRLYIDIFYDEQLIQFLHPHRREHPADYERFVSDMLTERWWTMGSEQVVDVAEGPDGRILGFSWWRRSWTNDRQRKAEEGWFSLRAWLSPIMLSLLRLRMKLQPYRSANPAMAGAERRAMPSILPLLQNPPARQKAWLLNTMAVDPTYQKQGLGTQLIERGLSRADKEDLTVWLVAREGLEGFYGRFGFVEKGRANVGELAKWDGGAVMFREDS